jgi:methylated-DNA-protein-cysteine methyltransferase related protein
VETEPFEDRVAAVLRGLGPGDVLSYGEVAAEAGAPGAARAVGSLLRRGLPGVPWWRVVRADGWIVCPNGAEQIARLRAEGVRVQGGRVARAGAGSIARPRSQEVPPCPKP